MTESARLVITVDSTQAKSAETDLLRMANASGEAQRATSQVEAAAKSAAVGLGSFRDAQGRITDGSGKLVTDLRKAEAGLDDMSSAVKKLSSSADTLKFQSLNDSVSRVTSSIDPFKSAVEDNAKKLLEAADGSNVFEEALGSLGEKASATGTLIKAALSFAGAAGIQGIIAQADAYGQMSDRLKMASDGTEEYSMVQSRLLESANRTYRPLEEAQELYIRTADSLRSMGAETKDVLDITDSFSYLMVTNAASADSASSAISAYSKAIQTGKVDSDGWQSILAATPTIVNSIAESTGKTTAEIRKLGIEGKLSVTDLNESLRKTAEANGLLADSMSTAVSDAMTKLSNSTKVYIGTSNESLGATDKLAAGIGFVADNIDVMASVIAGTAVGAMTLYTAKAGLSVAASIAGRAGNIALAQSAVEVAVANQLAARSATALAASNLAGATTSAAQTEMSAVLAASRIAEAQATGGVIAAQAGLRTASLGVLGVLGGPVGIAVLAGAAAASYLLFRDSTEEVRKSTVDLGGPLEQLIGKWEKLGTAQRVVMGNDAAADIKETSQAMQGEAAKVEAAFYKLGNVKGLPVDAWLAPLREFRQSTENGGNGIADFAQQLLSGVPAGSEFRAIVENAAASIEEQGEKASKLTAFLATLEQQTRSNTSANSDLAASTDTVGQKYVDQLKRQADFAGKLTEVEKVRISIAKGYAGTLSEVDQQAALAYAGTVDKANAASAATKTLTSETSKHVTAVENQAKALKDFEAQSAISTKSSNDMADAYLAGADSVRELAIQQKIEEELLKTGAGARDAVTAAVNREADAKDRLDITQSIASMRTETTQTLAQATATLQGKDALETFNIQKSMSIALSGKKIDIGSKEYEQLLEQTKAQLDANKALEQASKVEGIVDRLNPQIKLLKDFTAEQEALNAAIARYPENAALYQDALAKLGNEYEVNRSKATIWGQMTEGAIDRIDEAFATAWGNIGSGAESLWDNLKKGFKQTLGEIAHMLTTKPLLASISNWLTGTDNGQGVGSVWSKLLGGGGGGGASDSNGWGGMVSLGKNLYSAWSNLTGVGSSIASGYASGGIGGAIQGGAGYYGNMLSSIGSTLSNGFSSLVSTFTGATAAQTAATIGAQGVTSAVLSGAVTEGATAIGAQFTTGVATTTAATYAAAEAGAAATAASLGGQISAAMSSAAAMWPLAVIMGMYQSGKLYDAGVRPDASEMFASGGSAALGKASMIPQTLQSKAFEFTDGINSKLVGGKLAAIISGSTLHQAVWGAVGKKLFGGAWETKDGGISLGVDDGELDAKQYIYQKKKGGLFSSSKKRTRYSALDAETEDALGAAYNDKLLNSMGLFSALGVQLSESVFDGLNVAASKISTMGKTPEAIQEELDKWFTGLGDSAVSAISKATGSEIDDMSFDNLKIFVDRLYSVNTTLDQLNVGLIQTSVFGGKMAEQLVAWAGGMEAFTTATSSYYDNFFSETEKADDTLAAVRKQFEQLNIKLPESRDGYRSMIEAIDIQTEAGRQMFVTLTGLSGNAAQAYSILEQRANAANDALIGSATGAQSALQRAISAQQKAVQDAYNARVTSLNDMVSTATENVTGLTAVGNDLGAALKALRGDSDDAVKMLRTQAQATLQSALATARSGKSLSGFTGLEDALDTVSNNNTDLYGSMEDFARDQGRTANVVAELNGINGKQLTAAEKSLKGLEDQIKQAKDSYDLQMAQYDQQLEFAQAQIDALNGVDNSVMGVTAAINAMNLSVVAALAAMGGKATAGTSTNNGTLIDSVYKSLLGRDADAAGKAYWQGELASGSISYDQLAQAIANAAKANGVKVPGYATGGLIAGPGNGTSDSIFARLSNGEYVMSADSVRMFGTGLLDQMNAGQLPAFAMGGGIGETGPQLEVTGPSRIFNANQTASMLNGGGGNGELIAEVRQLRTENRQAQFQIVKLTQKIEQIMTQWNSEGTPKERDYAL